jgi:hypothetical protein
MLAVALVACWLYARRRTIAAGLDVSHTDLAVPLVFVTSLLGAKLISVIIPGDAEFVGELIQTHSRFRLIGLFIIGVPALFAYSKLTKLSFRGLLDLFALPVVLWLAIVRLGCFLAGCCWGDLTFEYSGLADVTDRQLAIQIYTLPWLSGDWILTVMSFPVDSFAYLQHVSLGLIDQGVVSSLTRSPDPALRDGAACRVTCGSETRRKQTANSRNDCACSHRGLCNAAVFYRIPASR